MTMDAAQVRDWASRVTVAASAVRSKYGAEARHRARELQECIRSGFATALDNAAVWRARGDASRAADVEAATVQIANEIDIDVARLAGPEVVPVQVIDRVWQALFLLLDETGDSLGVVFVDERAAPLSETRTPMRGGPRAPRVSRPRVRESSSGLGFGVGLVALGLVGLYAFRRRTGRR